MTAAPRTNRGTKGLMTAAALPLPLGLPPLIDPSPSLTPFIKWPGGKGQELPAIASAAPELSGRFIDPFVGGGSVLLAVPPQVAACVNDACPELIGLYDAGRTRNDEVHASLRGLALAWDTLSTLDELWSELGVAFLAESTSYAQRYLETRATSLQAALSTAGPSVWPSFETRVADELAAKFRRMREVQRDVGRMLSDPDLRANVEGSVRSSFYMTIRARYNAARLEERMDPWRLADFFFLREFAYAAMFRFNRRDEFNVPYGGVTYNRKSLSNKVDVLFGDALAARLRTTTFHRQDFEPFLAAVSPTSADFVFVDPPYDSDFSAYDNRAFTLFDQGRLASALRQIPSRVMVVIKDTPAIRGLYSDPRWHVLESDKTYMWTIKSRNDRAATHLTITNYVPERLHSSHRR